MRKIRQRLSGSIGARAGDILAGILSILMLALWISLTYRSVPQF